jgi:hypothetical protein
VKQVIGISSAAAAILLIGCDPALTIHQAEPTNEVSANRQVTIHVKATHQFIGNTWYAPEGKVTNSSGAPLAVTKVELAEGKATYENKPRRAGSYPVPISPGDTEVLDVWFDLNESVRKIFHAPTELRVHYRSGDKDEIAHTTIVGGRLDTSVH